MKYSFLLLFSFFFSFFLVADPKISIITSVYKGERFIEGFMRDIVKQTVFDQCELIIINANSPENEESVIKRYMRSYPNIIYVRLSNDPGLYAVWNIGISLASGKFITNANLDDRLSPSCYRIHMDILNKISDIDLVYSGFFISKSENETFATRSSNVCINYQEFAPERICRCLPGCNPMWRKSMHEKYGLFDESFRVAGDWEMWCRAVQGGAKFKKAPGINGLMYLNPKGLSTNKEKKQAIDAEKRRVCDVYRHLWT